MDTVAPFNREQTKLTFPETNMLTDAAAWKAECTYITPSLDPTRWPSEGEKFSIGNDADVAKQQQPAYAIYI